MTDIELSTLTTLRVGGPAHVRTFSEPGTLVDDILSVWGHDEDWLVLGGGSNLVIADSGFWGTVIRVATRGIEQLGDSEASSVTLRVQAGESWDALVAHTVDAGLSGIEALSGIPGMVGAAPVQNIGAYGQELSDTLVGVHFLHYETGEFGYVPAAELGMGYRTSLIKEGRREVITAVDLRLNRAVVNEAGLPLSEPIAYAQLAGALGAKQGDRVSLALLRQAVIALRGGKGMILDPADPDSVSAGSFFTNPIVPEEFARTLPPDAPRWVQQDSDEDIVVPLEHIAALDSVVPVAPGPRTVKLSAAWLIQHAGIHPGFSLPGSRAAVSSKHTLALVNTGGATASEIVQLARYIQLRVQSEFGLTLHPEPQLIGIEI